MADRPSGGDFSKSEKRGLLRSVLLAISNLLLLGSVVFFAAARADWTNLNCREWPQAGNCSDAVGVQVMMAFVALIAVFAGALLVRWRT